MPTPGSTSSACSRRRRSAPTTARTARRRRRARRSRAKSARTSTSLPAGCLAAPARTSRSPPACATASIRRRTRSTACRWRRPSAWASGSTQRAQNALKGIPSNASQIVTFDLAGPKNGKKGFYDWDKNNFAPRVALAWTPTERIVVRGGYSKVFDRVGVGLATNFDEGFAFGMSTPISSPFGLAYETNPGRALPRHHHDAVRRCRPRRRAASRRRRRFAPASSRRASTTRW